MWAPSSYSVYVLPDKLLQTTNMERWLSSEESEVTFRQRGRRSRSPSRQSGRESSSAQVLSRRVARGVGYDDNDPGSAGRRSTTGGQDDPRHLAHDVLFRKEEDDPKLSGLCHLRRVAQGEEEDDGQPTCHLRRVEQGGHGVGDASATTLSQSGARVRSAQLLLVLTPAGGRRGATSSAEIEQADGEWEQVPVLSSQEAGGRASSPRSVTLPPNLMSQPSYICYSNKLMHRILRMLFGVT